MQEKGEDNGGIWNAWDQSFHLFSYLYLSWFHKGFDLVVWDYQKKKWQNRIFPLPSLKQQQ